MADSEFPHLPLIQKIRGEAQLGQPPIPSDQVRTNQDNRVSHGNYLANQFGSVGGYAKKQRETRNAEGLPPLSGGAAFLLQIPDEHDEVLEWLSAKLDLEFVAEYDDGYVIVATEDIDLKEVHKLANAFIRADRGSGNMASVLEVYPDPSDIRRIERVLDESVQCFWPFDDDRPYLLDVSIEAAPHKKPKAKPTQNPNWKPETNEKKRTEHQKESMEYWEAFDKVCAQREREITDLIKHYNGEIKTNYTDGLVQFPDSFSMRIEMNGIGFTDLIKNHPSVFEVTIPDEIEQPFESPIQQAPASASFELLEPIDGATAVCVIDSGMQEGHRWLEAAIAKEDSFCFIPGVDNSDVADYVRDGGHGTRVASACIYPQVVPETGQYQAPFWLLNARALNDDCKLPSKLYPPELLVAVFNLYSSKAVIYQHSIASDAPCKTTRMSAWATAIDLLSHRNDVLFIQAAGNLKNSGNAMNPGIQEYLAAGRQHPEYLLEDNCRIANPAQSLQALTVGSISREYFDDGYKCSIAEHSYPSAFTRSGFGLWKSIKPEVVEFGGDYVKDTGQPTSLSIIGEVCPQMARSTLRGGQAVASDNVGTSFSAPKVAHIAGVLAGQFTGRSPLLYRALIANSARWPEWAEQGDPEKQILALRTIGYGVPSLDRATTNAPSRVCLIPEQEYTIKAGEAMIFGVPIPESIRGAGQEFPVRIDVTLSYSAEPRRTRKSRRGYLGAWLDWRSSNMGEEFETFQSRSIKNSVTENAVSSDKGFNWMLDRQDNWGTVRGGSRTNGTLQKDWAIAHGYELPDVFGVVVRGHRGWDRRNTEAIARFALVVSFEVLEGDIRIYEEIRAAVQTELEIRPLVTS
ncbi:MAG: S8 family peptidase [Verrucomicrobiota bacterium]